MGAYQLSPACRQAGTGVWTRLLYKIGGKFAIKKEPCRALEKVLEKVRAAAWSEKALRRGRQGRGKEVADPLSLFSAEADRGL